MSELAASTNLLHGRMENPNAGILTAIGPREVVRCGQCNLVQFRTISDLCRRCCLSLPRPQSELAAEAEAEAAQAATEAARASERTAEVHGKTMKEFQLGPRLRELREFKSLTQAQVARKAHVPRTYVSRIEHSHLLPGLGVAQRLADALQ